MDQPLLTPRGAAEEARADDPAGAPDFRKKSKVRAAWLSFISRILAQFIGATASITLGIALVNHHDPTPPAGGTAVESAPVRRVPSGGADATRALVVLPTVDFSPSAGHQGAADALTDVLTATLAQQDGLRVLSRTTAMHYRADATSVPAIARDLAVDLVLETSISVTADTLRVTAQLIDGRSDEHLWARTYTWAAADLPAAQDEAAKRIAWEIGVALAGTSPGAPTVK